MFSYDLYENSSFIKRTDNKKYALYWILDNYIKSNKTIKYYFDIIKYDTTNEQICVESIKIENNNVIKVNKYNNFYTIYSPYDLDLFDTTELSLLYQTIYNPFDVCGNIINTLSNKNTLSNTNTLSNKNTLSNTNTLSNKNKIDNNTKKASNEEMVFDKKELEMMTNLLESLKTEKKTVDNNFKEKENELADIDCNERFEKKKQKNEEERNKEKYNIFKSDIKIYDKLTTEKNFSENFIPPLFEGKYYILKFLFNNDYFNGETKETPSDEIFELYRILYDYMNDTFPEEETFNDLFEEFNNYLPKNKQIMTDRQMMDTLNEKSENTDLFKETTGFEDDKNNESVTSSQCVSEVECECKDVCTC